MNQIAPAFIKAKRAFMPAMKDKTNPAFRSKYADLGACLDAVDDALLEQGIAVYQETFMDESGVTVETVFLHESGETIRGGKLHVPAAKQDPQGYGSALTYARRYSLQAACGIAPEDDDGNSASKAVREPKPDSVGLANAVNAIKTAETVEDIGKHLKAAVAMFPASKDALQKHASERKAKVQPAILGEQA